MVQLKDFNVFQSVAVRVGSKVPTQVGAAFKDSDFPLCATYVGPPTSNTTENVDFVCPKNLQGQYVVVQKSGRILIIREIRLVYEPIQRKELF